jgi:CubicO group peptidase (beta-lactamase class C family)
MSAQFTRSVAIAIRLLAIRYTIPPSSSLKDPLMQTLLSRSSRIALLFASLYLSASAIAQDLPAAKPESVGLSSARLERITAKVQQQVDQKRIAGAVTLVARHGKVVYFKSQGSLDREANKPMRNDAIFRICSMTKPITSLAVMMLYEEGKFLLDDPISKYLPEFKNPKVFVKPANGADPYTIPASREITIRDLITHTSGITYTWDETLGKRYKDGHVGDGLVQYDGTIAENTKAIAAQPLLFQPGTRWEYSLGIDVLGRLVEVASGMPLDQFFQKRIFEPLGMQDTYFFLPDNKVDRLAAAYTYYDGKGLQRFPDTPITEGTLTYSADYSYRGPKKLFSGGAGLNSTVADYYRFSQFMLQGGKVGDVRLLSRKSVELMTHDQLGKISDEQAFGIGFGVDGVKTPLKEIGSVGSFGWGGFFYTTFSIDPKEDMIVIFMGQLHPTGGLELDRQVHQLAYQAITD